MGLWDIYSKFIPYKDNWLFLNQWIQVLLFYFKVTVIIYKRSDLRSSSSEELIIWHLTQCRVLKFYNYRYLGVTRGPIWIGLPFMRILPVRILIKAVWNFPALSSSSGTTSSSSSSSGSYNVLFHRSVSHRQAEYVSLLFACQAEFLSAGLTSYGPPAISGPWGQFFRPLPPTVIFLTKLGAMWQCHYLLASVAFLIIITFWQSNTLILFARIVRYAH